MKETVIHGAIQTKLIRRSGKPTRLEFAALLNPSLAKVLDCGHLFDRHGVPRLTLKKQDLDLEIVNCDVIILTDGLAKAEVQFQAPMMGRFTVSKRGGKKGKPASMRLDWSFDLTQNKDQFLQLAAFFLDWENGKFIVNVKHENDPQLHLPTAKAKKKAKAPKEKEPQQTTLNDEQGTPVLAGEAAAEHKRLMEMPRKVQ